MLVLSGQILTLPLFFGKREAILVLAVLALLNHAHRQLAVTIGSSRLSVGLRN